MIQDFKCAFSTASRDLVASNVGGKTYYSIPNGRDIRVRAGNVPGFGSPIQTLQQVFTVTGKNPK